MTDKEKLHQILSTLWKNDDSVGKTYYNQALQDVQTVIESQEGSVSEEQVKESLISKHDDKTCKENGNSLTQESVSEDLEEEIGKYCSNPENFITYIDVGFKQSPIKKDDIPLIIKAIKAGAQWQKKAFISKACDWLTKHAKKYYFNEKGYLGTDELVEDFKLIMEM